MPIPDECPSHNAKPCRGGKFEFVEGTEVCKDYQEVRISPMISPLGCPMVVVGGSDVPLGEAT